MAKMTQRKLADCPVCGEDVATVELKCAYTAARYFGLSDNDLIRVDGPAPLDELEPVTFHDRLERQAGADVLIVEPCEHRFQRQKYPEWVESFRS